MSEQQEQTAKKPVCDHCHKEVEAVYDLTPQAWSDSMTYYVCGDCYEDAARELEADGHYLTLG